MKNLSILFLFFLSCATITTPKLNIAQKKEYGSSFFHKVPPIVQRHVFRISFAIVLWIKHKEVVGTVKRHPFASIFLLGCFTKYFSDSYKMHTRIKKDFDILQKIEELYCLISYATEVSNVMIETSTTRSFNINEHFQNIVQDIPYSFEELEKMTLHILVKWKLKLKEKYPSLYPQAKGMLDTNVYLEDVDNIIYFFYENPQEQYQQICTKIALEIKKRVNEIHLLHVFELL